MGVRLATSASDSRILARVSSPARTSWSQSLFLFIYKKVGMHSVTITDVAPIDVVLYATLVLTSMLSTSTNSPTVRTMVQRLYDEHSSSFVVYP